MKQHKGLKPSKKAWAARLSLCLGFILSGAATAHADQPHHMVYEVYAGGIHAVQNKMSINFNDNGRYNIEMAAATRGFLGSLVPWSGTFESHGWVEQDGSFKPQLHKSTSTWQGEEEIKDYKYNRDGSFEGLIITEHEKPAKKEEVDDELTQGTIDAFTAAMMVMKKIEAGGECEGSAEVFDGSRRFEQIFAHQGYEELTPSKYNIYQGKAVICTLEVKPIAGKWHEKPRGWFSIQEQGRAKGTMPTVWMGQVGEDGPVVPIKIRVKTDYGALFMHLAEYRSGDEVLVAEKRVTEEE